MSESTARLTLPMLAVAQAQKEMTHNEALALVDIAAQPVVVAAGLTAPPATPAAGQCWIVGVGATGAWAGQAGAIAGWTTGGWRFLTPFEGMSAWSAADSGVARYEGGSWRIAARGSAIANPSGGTTVDSEVRAAVAAVLAIMRSAGLISS